jgi:hypothetical protein
MLCRYPTQVYGMKPDPALGHMPSAETERPPDYFGVFGGSVLAGQRIGDQPVRCGRRPCTVIRNIC